jgi:hypothetical protein
MAKFTYDDVIQEMSHRRSQDQAFAAALKALFEQYSVPNQFVDTRSARHAAFVSAANGAYRSAFYPQESSKAWKVPPDQLRAIHALVYG